MMPRTYLLAVLAKGDTAREAARKKAEDQHRKMGGKGQVVRQRCAPPRQPTPPDSAPKQCENSAAFACGWGGQVVPRVPASGKITPKAFEDILRRCSPLPCSPRSRAREADQAARRLLRVPLTEEEVISLFRQYGIDSYGHVWPPKIRCHRCSCWC